MRAFVTVFAVVVLSASALCPPAFGDLKVMDTEDVVRLVSGEEVRGTVIAVGVKAVIMIVGDTERSIPRREVASIERGEVRPTIKGYQTEAVNGVKLIVAEGFRESDAEGEEEAFDAEPGTARRPKAGKRAKRAKRGKSPIPEEKVDELMKNPEVRKLVEKMGGRDKAMEMARKYQGDPRFKSLIEQLLKTGKLPPGVDKMFR